MSIAHETVMFDVHDAKVAALLSDSTGSLPTYGPWTDVPGIAEVGLDPNFVTAELKGDARVIAKKGRIDRMNFSGTYGKLSLDVLGIILGSAVADLAAVASTPLTGLAADDDSTTVTGTGFTQALVGREITGTSIQPDTIVLAVNQAGTSMTISLPVTATIASGTASVAAVGAVARARIQAPAPLPYFGLKFKIEDLDVGVGDLHVVNHKCQITGGTLIGGSTDNFGQPSFDAEAIGLDGHLPDGSGGFDSNVMVDVNILDAVTALA